MSGSNNAAFVTAGKPRVGGGLWRAPKGTTLPSDATTALSGSFTCMGYISEDGLVNDNSPENTEVKAWGGDTVLNIATGRPDTFKCTLIEALNASIFESIYGAGNVSGSTLDAGISITANSKELSDYVYVVEMTLSGNVAKRIVIPSGKVTEVGSINYKDDEEVGYELTISATPDASGNTHYEYIKKSSTTL